MLTPAEIQNASQDPQVAADVAELLKEKTQALPVEAAPMSATPVPFKGSFLQSQEECDALTAILDIALKHQQMGGLAIARNVNVFMARIGAVYNELPAKIRQ